MGSVELSIFEAWTKLATKSHHISTSAAPILTLILILLGMQVLYVYIQ